MALRYRTAGESVLFERLNTAVRGGYDGMASGKVSKSKEYYYASKDGITPASTVLKNVGDPQMKVIMATKRGE